LKLAKGKACHWAFPEANKKTMTALGEACGKVLSDRGSIPLASTNTFKEIE